MKKQIKKNLKAKARWIAKKYQAVTWPKAEDVLFVFLLSFCALFGLSMFVIGERIKNEKEVAVYAPLPVINREVEKMVAGTPMEKMVPALSLKDDQVASFLVAIAKKESNWGKFSPKKEGRECYNYWGYRGPEDTTPSGYSCFKNPRHAINVVGGRIAKLIEQEIDTPSKMVVWKCGRNCEAAGGQAAADKWVTDVGYYYEKLYN